jgi:hypothetical protein
MSWHVKVIFLLSQQKRKQQEKLFILEMKNYFFTLNYFWSNITFIVLTYIITAFVRNKIQYFKTSESFLAQSKLICITFKICFCLINVSNLIKNDLHLFSVF